jgi:hypothetical protein
LLAANAGKAALRTIAADSATFILLNMGKFPVESFARGANVAARDQPD